MTKKDEHILGMAECRTRYSDCGRAVEFTFSTAEPLEREHLNTIAAAAILCGLVREFKLDLDEVISLVRSQGKEWGVA